MRFLILDDQPLIQTAIRQALTVEFPLAQIDTPASLADALQALDRHPADLMLLNLDLHAPAPADAFAGLRAVTGAHADQRVCVLSAADRAILVQQAMTLGACGFIPKSVAPGQLIAAIRVMLSGGCFFLQSLVAPMPTLSLPAGTAEPPSRITRRQGEIIDLLLAGHPNKGIARELGISLQTVKTHLTTLMAVLQVENRTQLALAVARFDQAQPGWRPGRDPGPGTPMEAFTAWVAGRAAAAPAGLPGRDTRTP